MSNLTLENINISLAQLLIREAEVWLYLCVIYLLVKRS